MHKKFLLAGAMQLIASGFSKTPETFNAVDVVLAASELVVFVF
jgi:hypothetical protein